MAARKTVKGFVVPTAKDCENFRKLHKFVEKIAIREGMLTKQQAQLVRVTITPNRGRTCAGKLMQDYHLAECFFGPTNENLIESWMLDPRQARRPAVQSMMRCYTAAMHMKAYAYIEYASFWNKPGISTFVTKDLNEAMVVLIAHEMSHTINQWHRRGSKWYGDNHDAGFQYTYRFLRALALSEYREWKEGALERKTAARNSKVLTEK